MTALTPSMIARAFRAQNRLASERASTQAPIQPQEPDQRKVYVIQCGEFIKIGISHHPPSRMRALQSSNPIRLELLHTFEGGKPVESELHKRFAEQRHSDEWFRLEGSLKEWVASLGVEP